MRGRLLIVDPTLASAVTLTASNDPVPETGLGGGADPRTLSVEPLTGRQTAVAGADLVDKARNGRGGAKRLERLLDRLVAAEFDRRTGGWAALVDDGATLELLPTAPDRPGQRPVRVTLPARATAVAPNPVDGLTYVLTDQLVAVGADGALRGTAPLDAPSLTNPVDMVFAPSTNTTDAPTTQSLFVVNDAPAGDTIVELAVVAAAAGTDGNATLVATRNLFQLSPASPDSAGIAYSPSEDRFYVSDSEVDEMTIFQNVNLWELTRAGVRTDTGVTLPWSDEPTGAGFDPNTNRLLISDDDANLITFVSPGTDGRHGTSDDTRTSFNVNSTGNSDAEDVAYDTARGQVAVVDGVNQEVYRYTPTGSFLGSFDIGRYGAIDPEGIAYEQATDRYIVVDHSSDSVYELSATGDLLAKVNIAAANAYKAAGIEVAPASDGSGAVHYYIVDRGVDNDGNPNENDGRMYEMAPPGGGGPANQLPQVNAGADQSITLPATASVSGTASDDGLPSNTLTTTWSETSGPGTVTFADPAALATTATFSAAGTYVLRLTANDGAGASFDEVTVTVANADGTVAFEVAVSNGNDDVEQNMTTNAVNLTNGDLELGADGTVPQQVGLRFQGVSVPKNATITRAYIQFTADETRTQAASLLVQGQAADNAPAFTNAAANVSSRARTISQVSWSPPAWSTIGAAGLGEQTPSLTPIVQELVNRAGWASGNSMVFVVSGTERRTAESFEGGAALAARLHVEYTTGPPVNQPPLVSAGADQTVTLPNTATMAASASDDGLPTASVTTGWSQVSGPGTAVFTTPSSATSTVTFPVEGSYVLRWTASDGLLSASDDVTVTVLPVPPLNSPPTANAGDDQNVVLPATATLTGTATDDGLPANTLTTSWTQQSGPATATVASPAALSTGVTLPLAGTYVFRLTANDSALTAFDEVSVTASNPVGLQTVQVAIAAGNNDAEQNLTTNSVSITGNDLELGVDNNTSQLVGLRFAGLTVPAGATIQNAYVQFVADETGGSAANLLVQGQAADNAAAFTTGNNNVGARARTTAQVPWVPASWTPVGASGAAQRTPNLATVVQEIVSRPGWVSGNALALVVSGTGTRTAEPFEGGATLAPRLVVEYTVGGGGGPTNVAPQASAGNDQTITLPASATLAGSVSDDGLPSNTLTSAWSVVSGPGTVTFGNANATNTTASFSAAGVYVLRLTANDTALSGTDDVQITVNPSAGGTTTVTVALTGGSNDAEQFLTTNVTDLSSSDLELGLDGSIAQQVGLRFTGLNLPPGAVVSNAYVQFTVDETSNAAASLSITGEAADNSAIFTTAVNNISARARTAASVPWVPVTWPTIGESGLAQRTPNVASVVQQIVSRPGWVSGNPVTLIITGTGRRTAEAFESGAALAPRLVVEYSVP